MMGVIATIGSLPGNCRSFFSGNSTVIGRALRAFGLVVAVLLATSPASAVDTLYEYDDLGRLVRASHPNGLVVQYSYDAAGNRTAKTTSAIQTFFSISDETVTEGGTLSFTVTRSGVITNEDTIHYHSSDVTASGGDDYSAVSGVLTFAANVTSLSVNVTTTDDPGLEIDETLKLHLSNAEPGVEISDGEGVGTILNNDLGSQITISDASGIEPENFAGYEEMVFTVTLDPAAGITQSVDYATSDGTAVDAQDYTAASGTLTFAPGETTKTVAVQVLDDYSSAVYEGDETVFMTLTNAAGGSVISDGSGTGTITDFDLPPVIDISMTATGSEPNSVFVMTATMSIASSFTQTVDYATASGSATAGVDMDDAFGTFTFVPGDTSEIRVINVLDDAIWEGMETFSVSLSNAASPATIGIDTAGGSITDDETVPTVRISHPIITIDDTAVEGQDIVLPVTLSGAAGTSLTFDYSTRNATAVAGVDFVGVSSTVTFAPGETIKNITIATIDNGSIDGSRSFYVDLTNPPAGIVITESQALAVITDDDATLAINDAPVTLEGDVLVFTVTRTGATDLSHNVNYATATGTAGTGDYTTTSGTLTFASGQTSKTIPVQTTQDSLIETNETMVVNLSAATNGATITDSQGVGTIYNDDVPNAPPVAVNDSYTALLSSPTTFYVLSNDSDPESDPLTITSVTQTWMGTAVIGGGGTYITFTNTAAVGDSGFFTYTISDGQGNSDTATVSVASPTGGGGGGPGN